MAKPQLIQGFESHSDGEDSMPTPPVFPFKKVTHVGFGMMVLILLATLGVSLWGIHQTVGIFESVIHAEEVSDELLRIFADLKEAEDQQREYLLTGNSQFLDSYHQAVEGTRADLLVLENLAMTPTRRDQVFPDFKNLIIHRLDLLQQIVDIRNTQGIQAAIEKIRSGEGMQLTAKIRQGIQNFHKEDVADFNRLHDTAHTMERLTIITMSIGLILIFSVCLFTFWKFKRDLTERQQLEQRLLEEAKLAEVSRRIADIGHDVKNMLTPIQMGMQLLEDELNEHFKSLPASIQDHTPTTQALYKDIIGMTRRGSSRIQLRVKEIADAVKGISSPPRFAACHLGKIVDSALDALRVTAEEQGVVLQSQGLDALPILQADEQRLFNAFYNLVNNAIPEVPSGGSVTITGALSPNRKEFILSVEDTGRGMAPDVLSSLFTYHVVSQKPGGTGLGTKIVKDVVDAHGGTIRVESTEGKGTTFTICLPKEGPAAEAV
jgi:signal transduction histidine kinase